jgi:hypothetical protein
VEGGLARKDGVIVDRTAALVVRVWLEDDAGFRARLTSAPTTGDEAAGADVTVATVATPGEVVAAVRAWLDDFVAGAEARD